MFIFIVVCATAGAAGNSDSITPSTAGKDMKRVGKPHLILLLRW
jgi:hypothetical protein